MNFLYFNKTLMLKLPLLDYQSKLIYFFLIENFCSEIQVEYGWLRIKREDIKRYFLKEKISISTDQVKRRLKKLSDVGFIFYKKEGNCLFVKVNGLEYNQKNEATQAVTYKKNVIISYLSEGYSFRSQANESYFLEKNEKYFENYSTQAVGQAVAHINSSFLQLNSIRYKIETQAVGQAVELNCPINLNEETMTYRQKMNGACFEKSAVKFNKKGFSPSFPYSPLTIPLLPLSTPIPKNYFYAGDFLEENFSISEIDQEYFYSQSPQADLAGRKKTNKKLEEMFSRFWKIYPLKKSRVAAYKSFQKINPSEELLQNIVYELHRQAQEKKKMEELGLWSPTWKHASTWLNGRCWEDELFDPSGLKPREDARGVNINYFDKETGEYSRGRKSELSQHLRSVDYILNKKLKEAEGKNLTVNKIHSSVNLKGNSRPVHFSELGGNKKFEKN